MRKDDKLKNNYKSQEYTKRKGSRYNMYLSLGIVKKKAIYKEQYSSLLQESKN